MTLGRYATAADIFVDTATLEKSGVDVVRSSRGGKVTYHGPGQLVAYPVCRLRHGVRRHVAWLADAAIAVAAELGIRAEYQHERPGVWVDGTRKLAAIGVHVDRGVAIHGLALNVTPEAADAFRRGWFLPCGETDGQVTSLIEARPALGAGAEVTPQATADTALTVEKVARLYAAALCRHPDCELPAVPAFQTVTAALLSESLSVE